MGMVHYGGALSRGNLYYMEYVKQERYIQVVSGKTGADKGFADMEYTNYTTEYIKSVGVDFNCLSYSYDGNFILDNPEDEGGKPFSGVAYELYQNGNLAYYCFYQNGLSHGVYRSFYENGNVKCQQMMQYGMVFGKMECFYENGMMKSSSNNEQGVQLSYKEWDNQGKLIVETELKPGDSNYEIFLRRREDYKAFIGQFDDNSNNHSDRK